MLIKENEMNKYEKILKIIGKILGFIGCMSGIFVLLTIAILILCYEDTRSSMGMGVALLIEFVLFISIHVTSYFVGLWFLGDRYSASHVSDGDTVWWPEKTYGYVKRNMITNLVETIASLVFAVFYAVLICIGRGYFVIGLIGLIVSLITGTVFYLFYKKQQLKVKNENLSN